jgi:HAD superfamily hydrolase (TIGR01549 family)
VPGGRPRGGAFFDPPARPLHPSEDRSLRPHREHVIIIRAAIFDIDGTLVDSVDLHAAAWQQAFRHFGKDVAFEKVRQQIGKGADQLMPVFFTRAELDRFGKDLEKYRKELFLREYLPRVRPFPRVRELFERIRADGKRIVLASSAPKKEYTTYVKVLNIKDLVEGGTSADDVEKSKPHPDIIEAALGVLGDVPARDALAVGDTPYDAEAAGKSGLRTLGVLCGGLPEADLRAAGCIAIFRDPADLLARYEQSPLATR